MMESGVPVCNSCGEQVGVNNNGEVFVACHECNFSICKACVDYEIKEGRKACLRCAAPYEGNSRALEFQIQIYLRLFEGFIFCII